MKNRADWASRKRLNQGGMVGPLVILVGIVLVSVIIFTVWRIQGAKEVSVDSNATTQTVNQGTSTGEQQEDDSQHMSIPEGWVEYTDAALGISFHYPGDWVTLKCDSGLGGLYLGSDGRNIGLGDSESESILCGGGTDFPPQIVFDISTSDLTDFSRSGLTIDSHRAIKAEAVSTEEGLRPAGFKTVMYTIEGESQDLKIVYNQWPDTEDYSAAYDVDPVNEDTFSRIVEETLQFEQ